MSKKTKTTDAAPRTHHELPEHGDAAHESKGDKPDAHHDKPHDKPHDKSHGKAEMDVEHAQVDHADLISRAFATLRHPMSQQSVH